MNFYISFILCLLASLSTCLGFFIIFLQNKSKQNTIINALSFSASVMLFVSLFDLLPTSYKLISSSFNNVFTVLFIILFVVIGFNISSFISNITACRVNNKSKLYKIGITSMIAIILHNIPEGMATFISSYNDLSLGILLTISIALHNIPEGISIALPIYYETNKKFKTFMFTLISGFCELIGGLIAYFILHPFINNIVLGVLFSLIAGIMMFVAIFELLKEAVSYKNYKRIIIYFIIGLILTIISVVMF